MVLLALIDFILKMSFYAILLIGLTLILVFFMQNRIEKYSSNMPNHRTFRKNAFNRIASSAMAANRPSEARSAAFSSLQNKPSFKALAFILVSLLGEKTYRIVRRKAQAFK